MLPMDFFELKVSCRKGLNPALEMKDETSGSFGTSWRVSRSGAGAPVSSEVGEEMEGKFI